MYQTDDDQKEDTLEDLMKPMFEYESSWTNYQVNRIYDMNDLNDTHYSVL